LLTEALGRLREALDGEAWQDEGLAFDHLRHSVRETARLMGSELADWRTAQQARPLTLPG
jgi:signal transduction histidine kinase